jgi:hypothetical protein
MTRAEVLAWLESRRPAPPAALAACLAGAVTDAPLPLSEHLALLGQRMLTRVADRPKGGRELALELLAADAFVTYAFEAQAEADVAGVAPLADGVARGAASAAGGP